MSEEMIKEEGKPVANKMGTEPVDKVLLSMGIPMILSMVLQACYNIVDSMFVARISDYDGIEHAGEYAMNALTLAFPVQMLIVAFAIGTGVGVNALLARTLGAKNVKKVARVAGNGIFLGLVIYAFFFVFGLVGIDAYLMSQKSDPVTLSMGHTHLKICTLLCLGNVMFAIYEKLLQSTGKSVFSTTAQIAGAVTNIVLDPIFIFGWFGLPEMRIAGAAWATVISSTLSCVVMSYWMWGKKDLYLDLSPKNFDFHGKMMIDILQVAIPSTLELIVFSALAVIINSFLVQASGTQAVAVYTASMRIVQLAMIPLMGIGTAVLTVSGIAYGAHNYKNLQTAHSYSIKLGFIISIAIGILMFLFASQIAGVFSYTEASAGLSGEIASAISVLSLFVLAIPHGIMSSMMFQGVGKGTYSLLVTLLRSLILESLFAYIFCFTFGWGVAGIYGGVVFGCFVGGTIGYIWAKLFIRKFREISIRKYASKNE